MYMKKTSSIMASLARVKEAVVVTPSEPTPSCVLSLSAIDSQPFLRFTIEYLLIYTPRPGTNQAATATRVKSALAKALVPYYPLAGRVRPKPNDLSGRLEVLCRGQGAVFIEAVSDRATHSEFQHAPHYVTQWRKLLSLQVADVLKGAPPLVVQLTWFKDGAAALGVGFNHCLCDGIGSAEFLNYFAGLATADKCGGATVKPVWDRHLMDPQPLQVIHPRQQRHQPEFDKVPDLCGFMNRFTNERLCPTSTVFSGRAITELKTLTRLSNELTYTSFELLSGHVWRSWARSLSLPSNQILKLLFSVNVRQRVNPSLPKGYYGNAFVLGCAVTTVKDLTEKGLSYAAGLVRRAKERVGDEYVRGVVEALGGASKPCPDSVGVLIVSQWSRLGLERVDFGMGRPVHVGPICSDRYCLFLPVSGGGSDDGDGQEESVKVMVAVPTSAVDKYELLVNSPYS